MTKLRALYKGPHVALRVRDGDDEKQAAESPVALSTLSKPNGSEQGNLKGPIYVPESLRLPPMLSDEERA